MPDGLGETQQQSASALDAVPLFPLPNIVLFPHAVLPLHIFEQRYKEMTADALRGARQIAMALLKPGWERDYYGHPDIEPVVCVGTICSHERLPDGNYNFLLQGHTRARIVREVARSPYRIAQLEPLTPGGASPADLEGLRRDLSNLLERERYQALPGARQILELLRGSAAVDAVADLIAFTCLDDQVAFKQMLLAESDVARRVRRVVEALRSLAPRWQHRPADPRVN